jgi:hypothetical protein
MATSIPQYCFFASANAAATSPTFVKSPLNSKRLTACRLDTGDGLVSISFGGCAVVVDADFCAIGCEAAADQTAQVFCTAADKDDFFFQWTIAHKRSFLVCWFVCWVFAYERFDAREGFWQSYGSQSVSKNVEMQPLRTSSMWS